MICSDQVTLAIWLSFGLGCAAIFMWGVIMYVTLQHRWKLEERDYYKTEIFDKL